MERRKIDMSKEDMGDGRDNVHDDDTPSMEECCESEIQGVKQAEFAFKDESVAPEPLCESDRQGVSLPVRCIRKCKRSWKSLTTISVLVVSLLAITYIGMDKIESLKESNQALQGNVAELQQEKRQLQTDYNSLENKYEELKNDAQRLRSDLSGLQDQQATIDDAAAKLNELHSQYDALLIERDGLQEQVDAKKMAAERAAREKEQRELAQNSNIGGTVYWVPSGKVYHTTPNCATLKRSSDIRSGSVSASGKSRVCKICG